MKHSCNYVFNGKCPKIHNTLRPAKKHTSTAIKAMYMDGVKLVKKDARTDKKTSVRTIKFDIDVDQYRERQRTTAKYHKPYKQEFTRVIVNGKTLFIFND